MHFQEILKIVESQRLNGERLPNWPHCSEWRKTNRDCGLPLDGEGRVSNENAPPSVHRHHTASGSIGVYGASKGNMWKEKQAR